MEQLRPGLHPSFLDDPLQLRSPVHAGISTLTDDMHRSFRSKSKSLFQMGTQFRIDRNDPHPSFGGVDAKGLPLPVNILPGQGQMLTSGSLQLIYRYV